MLRALVLFVLPSALLGCVTSVQKGVTVHQAAPEDPAYSKALDKVTAQYEVIKNFETRYELQATALTLDFRKALAERYERIFDERQPVLGEASDKLAFFVSLYTMNKDVNDLTDQHLWNVQLVNGATPTKPFKIERLSRKERWQPFFPYISPWSKEYLVIFDAPAGGDSSEEFLKKSQIQLIFTNADGKVSMNW